MVTINTAADLLRALAENRRWQEAVRRATLIEQRQFQRGTEGSQCAN